MTASNIPWHKIDTVLLDMDGTLLDLHFDYHFWMEFIPSVYAKQNNLSLEDALSFISEKIHSQQGTLNWYCLDYWTEQLQLPIAKLKQELKHLIQAHPDVITFLKRLQQLNKQVIMVTNAHPDSLAIKLEMTEIGHYFDQVISSHDFGIPKEDVNLWQAIREKYPFEPANTLLIDDNLHALASAKAFGIAYPLAAIHVSPKMDKIDPGHFPYFKLYSEIIPPIA
ncbi:MAG: HAD family hydrolase [Piscirickettsiaceae bacterium CG_4_9_14_3_um_filter_43_564]|nr:GMP/IMP nucleotidase [Thiomicrospira sp.]PIQ03039.1 MAG: HAD family hydrolase [Piscirickettsiaceae bacterium CG18_big_fil_WC_8_21_14_2_50_44_103]PIU38682.1 MAG: HAD family hydrolase [Piscirickettsiaceae bacterium CG07_land_8_20_14_0_80_44_28]PIW57093.1 MAG: HAD family hydrolase [Piscirickettsiaceae bacterium CG12_big_fil_rev_8_21_14_0_65_44_934]PIW76804.1 MAG: HAD family hydrolase [Piscirickettsiaceae bacterium CG_4_8_14_3_um_filter_44_38]PIX79812.1 MAG: HAD family hydrolase [Piscirickettsi